MGTGRTPFGDQLGPDDRHLPRRLDAQAHLTGFQPHHCDADIIPDEEFLHQFPGEHEHVLLSPRGLSGIGFVHVR